MTYKGYDSYVKLFYQLSKIQFDNNKIELLEGTKKTQTIILVMIAKINFYKLV